jgi:hypothetical protein
VPLILAAFAILAVLVGIVLLVPVSLVLRYRAGTTRRLARRWIVTINLLGLALSVAMFLSASALTTVWVPNAFTYAVAGLAGGCGLGALGLLLTRWEATPRGLYYTPSRALVLIVTLVVMARVLYGFWRSWQAWQSAAAGESWLVEAGVAGSLAAGAVVLGYYLVYWAGVRNRSQGPTANS